MKLGVISGFMIEEMDMGLAASPLSNDSGSDIFACDNNEGLVEVAGGGTGAADTAGGVGSGSGFFSLAAGAGFAFAAGDRLTSGSRVGMLSCEEQYCTDVCFAGQDGTYLIRKVSVVLVFIFRFFFIASARETAFAITR